MDSVYWGGVETGRFHPPIKPFLFFGLPRFPVEDMVLTEQIRRQNRRTDTHELYFVLRGQPVGDRKTKI